MRMLQGSSAVQGEVALSSISEDEYLENEPQLQATFGNTRMNDAEGDSRCVHHTITTVTLSPRSPELLHYHYNVKCCESNRRNL